MGEFESMREEIIRMQRNKLRDEARCHLRVGYAAAMSKVCASVAEAQMYAALFRPDEIEAREAMAESFRWQRAGAVASLGDPQVVLDYLRGDGSGRR